LVVVFFVVASAIATPPKVGMVFIFIAVFCKPRIKCSHIGQKITLPFLAAKDEESITLLPISVPRAAKLARECGNSELFQIHY